MLKYQIERIYYRKRNRKSSKYLEYGMFGCPLGYPEKDKFFRKRVMRMIERREFQ